MALWYIPKDLEKSNDAEITKGKGKAIAVIPCFMDDVNIHKARNFFNKCHHFLYIKIPCMHKI